MTSSIQPAFPQPEMSWRRKRSPNTLNRIEIQITNPKKTSIVQMMFSSG